jgi:hypothetical protein
MPIDTTADYHVTERMCTAIGKQLIIKSYNLRLQAVKKLAWVFFEPKVADEIVATPSLEISCSFDELHRKYEELISQIEFITDFERKLKQISSEQGKQDDPEYALNIMVKHVRDTVAASEAFDKTYEDVVQNAEQTMECDSEELVDEECTDGGEWDLVHNS